MEKTDLIWSMLIHLGGNMWNEEGNTRGREKEPDAIASSKLRFSRPLWDEYLTTQKDAGINMIILDIGEGLRYESHPELAVDLINDYIEMVGECTVEKKPTQEGRNIFTILAPAKTK